MRKPFSDWELENFVGLAMLALVTLFMVFGMAAIGFVCWASTQTPSQPRQEVSQYVDTRGDVKRLCLAYKTGDHVDAISCNVIDDINGELR